MRRLGIYFMSCLLALSLLAGASSSALSAGRMSPRPTLFRGSQTQFPFIPQGVNPSLHDPFHSLYEWKIDHNPYDEPCHYDETYGQWVGPCNSSLDQPGFSITVPNRIRR